MTLRRVSDGKGLVVRQRAQALHQGELSARGDARDVIRAEVGTVDHHLPTSDDREVALAREDHVRDRRDVLHLPSVVERRVGETEVTVQLERDGRCALRTGQHVATVPDADDCSGRQSAVDIGARRCSDEVGTAGQPSEALDDGDDVHASSIDESAVAAPGSSTGRRRADRTELRSPS
jgi:hypothetical protein